MFRTIKMSAVLPNPAKTALRNEVSKRLATLTPEEKSRQSQIVYQKLINHERYKSSKRISIFLSTDTEVDTAPILQNILDRGVAAFVPNYAGGKMRMLRYNPGDGEQMTVTRHGISQHSKEQVTEDALDTGGLDLVIAPGVAFSRTGRRLGHGGGYYDKYLKCLKSDQSPQKPYVLAVAFNEQIFPEAEIPLDQHDEIIDEVLTAE